MSFENEDMLSPEEKEEIAKQNLSKIEEANSQKKQSSIYGVDQGQIPSQFKKPPNEYEVHQMNKGNFSEQSETSNIRVIQFVDKDGNTIDVDDRNNIHNYGMPKIGYYYVPEGFLPSGGLFYNKGYSIAYRSANTAEMAYYGTTDRGDYLEFGDAVNYMIKNCCDIRIRTNRSSHLDLLECDRMYLLFCIRELTMPMGTQPFTIEHDCVCGYLNQVSITKDNINKIDWNTPIDDDPKLTLMNYYNPDKRCFDIKTINGENDMMLYVPTVGTVQKIFKFMNTEAQKRRNANLDNIYSFKEYSKLYYMVPDHNLIIQDKLGGCPYINNLIKQRNSWSVDKVQMFIELTNLIEAACTSQVKYICKGCGEEVTADIMFPEGYTALFRNESTKLSNKLYKV